VYECINSVRGKHPRDVRTHQSEHIFLVNFRHCTYKLGTHLLARTAPLLAVLPAIMACTAHAMSAFACCAVPTATAIAAVWYRERFAAGTLQLLTFELLRLQDSVRGPLASKTSLQRWTASRHSSLPHAT